MRFLFVVPYFTGHVLPTLSVAAELALRGHDSAWVGDPSIRELLPPTAALFALGARPPSLVNDKRGFESLKFLYEDVIIPMARETLPDISRTIARYRPHVVVVDHQAFAGALAARQAGLPWATLCTTSVAAAEPLAEFPAAKRWLQRLLADMEREAGLPSWESPDLSPELVVVFSTPELADPERSWPGHFRFVGPSVHARQEQIAFPWEALTARPRIFVSLGTAGTVTRADRAFYAATLEAFRTFPGQVVLVAPEGVVTHVPDHIIVRSRVPQVALLEHVDAVICHAGHNTVCEALACGLPLVVAPIRHDQPLVAQQVARAGAGLRVRFGRVTAPQLRASTERVLSEPDFRAAASGIARGFRAAGGARAAAQALEALV